MNYKENNIKAFMRIRKEIMPEILGTRSEESPYISGDIVRIQKNGTDELGIILSHIPDNVHYNEGSETVELPDSGETFFENRYVALVMGEQQNYAWRIRYPTLNQMEMLVPLEDQPSSSDSPILEYCESYCFVSNCDKCPLALLRPDLRTGELNKRKRKEP